MFADRTRWNLTTNRLSEALARHRSGGRRLLDLSASNPTECGFRYDTGAIMRALCSPSSLGYHPEPQGLKSAREAVAGYYAHRGEYVFIEDVVLTTSTSEAYSFVFRLLCNPADELLIPTPSYPLFDFLADLQDVKLKPYPLIYDHGWQIDFHALESAIGERTRGIILVHPNNPTGHFTSFLDIDRLNHLCSAHGLALIADEVFLDFGIKDRSPSFSANREAPTFTLSGLSKISGLPQMKFAWLIVSGPEDWKREALARLEVIADTYLSMNAPIQHAAPALLKQRHGFQRQLMERVRANLEELDRQLAAQTHCSRLELQAGWYAVLRVPATRSDEELAIELLEKHDVYVHPGHFYDFPREGFLVVSLITPAADFAEGIREVLEIGASEHG